jgi:hypothetical protein
VVLAGAQRAPGLLVFVDWMAANAWTQSSREDLIACAADRSSHGRPPYADALTLHQRHTKRISHSSAATVSEPD